MRAQEPGTETPAPNTGLNPPLNPNRLISDFDRSAALQLLLRERQPLHLARSYRCIGRGLCGDARDSVDVFHRRPAWHLLRDAGFAARTSAAHPALFLRQPAPFGSVGSTRTAFGLPSLALTKSTPQLPSAPQTPVWWLVLGFW